MTVPVEHRAFASEVAASRAQDSMPAFAALAKTTGIPVDELVHYALVRWTAAGAELLMSVEPQAYVTPWQRGNAKTGIR